MRPIRLKFKKIKGLASIVELIAKKTRNFRNGRGNYGEILAKKLQKTIRERS